MEYDVMQNSWSTLTDGEVRHHLFSEVCELICLCNRKRNICKELGEGLSQAEGQGGTHLHVSIIGQRPKEHITQGKTSLR